MIGRSMPPQRLEQVHETIASSPAVDELLDLYAVYIAPQEALVAAKVHPVAGQTSEQLADRLDDLDVTLRHKLPDVGEVFIDLTANRRGHP
jgi:divalent metal cation (Fe/Co/Zn/Cd) transporter